MFKLIKEIRSKADELHFKRWEIINFPFGYGVYLHYIAKADEDKALLQYYW